MHYLVTGQQAALIDRYTIEEVGVPQLVLMERASLAVAEEVRDQIGDREKEKILVVAESGNNGGDGIAAARILKQRGYRAEVCAINGISRQTEAYQKQVELAEKAGVRFIPFQDTPEQMKCFAGYDMIVDAIFGVGLTREVTGIQKSAVLAILAAGQAGAKILSVDIPTGISSETGEVLGTAVRADITVTFGYEKTGMRFAKAYCGTVKTKEIGFYLPDAFQAETGYFSYDAEDIPKLLPKRSPDGNKGSFGNVLLIAGSKDMSGAAFLAAEAAYRTGCGLVKIVTHKSNRPALQKMLPEAVLLTYDDEDENFRETFPSVLEKSRVTILGPGLGQSEMAVWLTKTTVSGAGGTLIIDADAINILSVHPEFIRDTGEEIDAGGNAAGYDAAGTSGKGAAKKSGRILTPHMLEMTRLREGTLRPGRDAVDRLKKERFRAVKEVSEKYGAVTVLKDACTVVSAGGSFGDDKREMYFLNSSGNDAMAKGGSGDVLTGVIAGLAAQGLEAEKAACLGVYLHGIAGDLAKEKTGSYGMIARDLIAALPEAMMVTK